MAAAWPTHVAKARAARKVKASTKKRNRKLRRLYKDGKRGEVNA